MLPPSTHFLVLQTELLDNYDAQLKGEPIDVIAQSPERSELIGFRNATFAWTNSTDGAATPSRRNFRLCVEEELLFETGCINLIVGPTGSGKTSLLMALLGTHLQFAADFVQPHSSL